MVIYNFLTIKMQQHFITYDLHSTALTAFAFFTTIIYSTVNHFTMQHTWLQQPDHHYYFIQLFTAKLGIQCNHGGVSATTPNLATHLPRTRFLPFIILNNKCHINSGKLPTNIQQFQIAFNLPVTDCNTNVYGQFHWSVTVIHTENAKLYHIPPPANHHHSSYLI
jgi:hypothetical protein